MSLTLAPVPTDKETIRVLLADVFVPSAYGVCPRYRHRSVPKFPSGVP